MILTCPSCATRYIVNPQAIGSTGRTVRCANCQHQWHQAAPSDLPHAIDLAPPPPAEYQEYRPTPGTNLPAFPQAPAKRGISTGWLIFGIVLVGGLFGLVQGRDAIVHAWAPAARLYETVGLSLKVLGDGLDLKNVTSKIQGENSSLTVEGDVVNISQRAVTVPLLQAMITGDSKQVLKRWTFQAGTPVLRPGETAHFQTEQSDVPKDGANLAVTFTER